MGKILVIGSANMDFVIRTPEIPLPGETVLGTSLTLIPGGKGANQAYAAGKLGAQTAMIGAVGNDTNGQALLQSLQSVGVDTSGMEILEKEPTGAAFISVNDKGQNNIIVVPGANGRVTTEQIHAHEALFDESDIVVFQLEIPMETVVEAARIAKAKGKMVILDPAPAPEMLPDELIRNVDILKPNEHELARISGMPTDTPEHIRAAADAMFARGVKTLVVTLGGSGSALVEPGHMEVFPAHKVEVVDTTAAGDSFTAAFALSLTNGESCADAIRFASRVSSIVVTRKGAQTSIPSMAEVLEQP